MNKRPNEILRVPLRDSPVIGILQENPDHSETLVITNPETKARLSLDFSAIVTDFRAALYYVTSERELVGYLTVLYAKQLQPVSGFEVSSVYQWTPTETADA